MLDKLNIGLFESRQYCGSEPPSILSARAGGCVLLMDEWLLDPPAGGLLRIIFELIGRRYDAASTIFCTQYKQSDWRARLDADALADAIMDHVVHDTIWVETGGRNMCEVYSRPEH
ncbi:ATP-binding protein [Glutamicibacter sp. NPDC087673]|uniref:ATP-binding protein n=1 Tax=Glutamicibacter sp. NPDC087673 TaxID=3363997 RepID=UPI0037F11E18